MKTAKVDNTYFGARIVINKKGFKNLAKDLADSGQISLNTTSSTGTNLCASSTPWAIKNPIPDKNGYVYPVKELADDTEKRLYNIKNRNLSPLKSVGIKFNKKGYDNLGQDSADFSMTTFPSVKLSSSTILETSALPSEFESRKGFLGKITENFKEITDTFKRIGKRNINTVLINNPKELTAQSIDSVNISGNAGTGASSLLTGISSYIGSAATGIDTLIYHADLPKSVVNSAQNTDFVNLIHNGMAKCNQEPLDRILGSTTLTSVGFATQIQGLKFINKANKIMEANRKFPS